MEDDEHDPWNDPSLRHPRAAALMQDEALWSCANELAPFGSDEGDESYWAYRDWRAENPECNLVDFLSLILKGREAEYNASLTEDAVIGDSDESAVGFGYSDAFILDATIIATVLAQLVDEGRIDAEAKPLARVAIARQCHPSLLAYYGDGHGEERRAILQLAIQAIEAG